MTSYSGSSVNRAASQSAKDSRQEGHARETTFIVLTFLKRWDTPQHVDNDQLIDLVIGLVIFKLACYRESFIRRPRLPAIGRSGRHLVQREALSVSWPPPGHQQLVVVARC